jgi:hypothetical protein
VLLDDVEQSAGHFSWYSYARSSLLALNHLDEEHDLRDAYLYSKARHSG